MITVDSGPIIWTCWEFLSRKSFLGREIFKVGPCKYTGRRNSTQEEKALTEAKRKASNDRGAQLSCYLRNLIHQFVPKAHFQWVEHSRGSTVLTFGLWDSPKVFLKPPSTVQQSRELSPKLLCLLFTSRLASWTGIMGTCPPFPFPSSQANISHTGSWL